MGTIKDTYLEPDILECEVKAVIGNINRTNLDGIPAELFKIRKDDAVKMLHSICQQIWKTQSNGHKSGKDKFSFQLQRKAMPKNAQIIANYTHFTC